MNTERYISLAYRKNKERDKKLQRLILLLYMNTKEREREDVFMCGCFLKVWQGGNNSANTCAVAHIS